jgi:hypothetical protein
MVQIFGLWGLPPLFEVVPEDDDFCGAVRCNDAASNIRAVQNERGLGFCFWGNLVHLVQRARA